MATGWSPRPSAKSKIAPLIPVPDLPCHQLERLQDAFIHEGLAYEYDPEREQEAEALRSSGYPVLAVNIRASKLNKLVTGAPIYTYSTPGADIRLVNFLAQRWPLDYMPD